MVVDAGKDFKDPGYTVTDNFDTNVGKNVKVTGTVDTKNPGTYEIRYSVQDHAGNKTEAVRTVYVLPVVKAKNVSIQNNIETDKITLKGLTPGFTYKVYKDEGLKQKLGEFTPAKSTHTLDKVKLNDKGGSLYIVAGKSGNYSSTKIKVSYKAQPTPALASKSIKVTNGKKQDTIKLTGLKKGTKYVIYKDAKKKKVIASFTAKGKTKTIKVKQLGKKGGTIYITAKAPGYETSTVTIVKFSKEK